MNMIDLFYILLLQCGFVKDLVLLHWQITLIYNITYQKAARQEKYFTDSDEKADIGLRREKAHTKEFERVKRDASNLLITVELKVPTAKQSRLYVIGYYQVEYIYILSNNGLTTNYKECTVQKTKKQILKMIKILYVNKRGRLILGKRH